MSDMLNGLLQVTKLRCAQTIPKQRPHHVVPFKYHLHLVPKLSGRSDTLPLALHLFLHSNVHELEYYAFY